MINFLAEQMLKFQILFGQFSNFLSIGPNAHLLVKKIQELLVYHSTDIEKLSDVYESLIIVDRISDLITVFKP